MNKTYWTKSPCQAYMLDRPVYWIDWWILIVGQPIHAGGQTLYAHLLTSSTKGTQSVHIYTCENISHVYLRASSTQPHENIMNTRRWARWGAYSDKGIIELNHMYPRPTQIIVWVNRPWSLFLMSINIAFVTTKWHIFIDQIYSQKLSVCSQLRVNSIRVRIVKGKIRFRRINLHTKVQV